MKEMRTMLTPLLDATLEEWGLTEKWEARGLETGLQKGREEGLQKGRIEAVRRLQKHGMDPTQIAEFLELPPDTVFRYLETE
jgi:predicted transposase/invertase (TIGR01784 family)